MEDTDLFIRYCQYHGCWWPGDDESQGINSHCIDLIFPSYSSLRAKRVNEVDLNIHASCNFQHFSEAYFEKNDEAKYKYVYIEPL